MLGCYAGSQVDEYYESKQQEDEQSRRHERFLEGLGYLQTLVDPSIRIATYADYEAVLSSPSYAAKKDFIQQTYNDYMKPYILAMRPSPRADATHAPTTNQSRS